MAGVLDEITQSSFLSSAKREVMCISTPPGRSRDQVFAKKKSRMGLVRYLGSVAAVTFLTEDAVDPKGNIGDRQVELPGRARRGIITRPSKSPFLSVTAQNRVESSHENQFHGTQR